jgi:hypothetical protein
MSERELFISGDFEAVHPDPVKWGVVNAGFTAYAHGGGGTDRVNVGKISVNFVPGEADADTLAWWNADEKRAATYASFAKDALPPADAMKRIRDWITSVSAGYKRVYLVFMPTIYDGALLYAYWLHYLGHPSGGKGPGFTAYDVRSYGAGRLGCSLAEANKTRAFAPYMPDPETLPHTHTGLDDAEEQIHLFFNLMDGRKTK